jgi:predicted metal-dependent hydrolase
MSSERLLAGLSAPLTLKASPTARTMRLRVDARTGGVVLTFPRRVSQRRALEWAAGHTAWIEAALAKVPERVALVPGAALPLYGLPHLIDWSEDRVRTVRIEPGRIVLGGPADGLESRLLRWLKRHARGILEAETHEFAGKAGVDITRVGVGDPSSRWGSCSSSGGIRYSWRLILAPDWVRRATVAHEVAHRIHMNHGPEFHALVDKLLGADPAPARLWLRREGASLHRIGRL